MVLKKAGVPRDQARAAGLERIEEFFRPADAGERHDPRAQHVQGGVGVGREAAVEDRLARGFEQGRGGAALFAISDHQRRR